MSKWQMLPGMEIDYQAYKRINSKYYEYYLEAPANSQTAFDLIR